MILRDFRGGETGLNMLTYNKQKKTSAFLPRLGGSSLFFFFFSSCSHLFITMLFPGPAAVSILIKANHPTNRCSWSCLGQLPGNVIAQLGWPAPAQPPSQVPVQGMCPWAVNVSLRVQSLASQLASWTQAGGCGGVGWAYRDRGASTSYQPYLFISSFCFFQEIHHLIILCHQVPLATIWKYFLRISLPDCFR